MRIISKLVAASVVLGALTTAASAATVFSVTPYDPLHPTAALNAYAPGTLVWNFDGVANSNFSYSVGAGAQTSYSGSITNVVAEPAGDTSNFGAAELGGDATFAADHGYFDTLGVYLGSLDGYNTITFLSGNTQVGVSLFGNELSNPTGNADGNQSSGVTNGYFLFTFDAGADVNKVVFSSTSPAFEFDNIAAVVSGVPEPATWAMMIVGFGFIGFMLRSGRRAGVVDAVA